MAIKFIGFAAVIFALWRLHKRGQSRFEELKYHVEKCSWEAWDYTRYRSDELFCELIELEGMVRECEGDRHPIHLLRDYGFVERETPNTQAIISCDILKSTQETT